MAGPTLYTTFENKLGKITIDIIDNGDEAYFFTRKYWRDKI